MSSSQTPPADHAQVIAAPAITHEENFPVASWLCPPHLRPPIAAIYAFARTADDIADEGAASADQRLSDLAAFRSALHAAAASTQAGTFSQDGLRWPQVFGPLSRAITIYKLPVGLLDDLLSAFEQDVAYTRDQRCYLDDAELLDYCRRSANPIGRLLLHLYDINDDASLARSDDICSALQLINFWQDLSIDLPRGRHYLPEDALARCGVSRQVLAQGLSTPAVRGLLRDRVDHARAMMLRGAVLPKRVAGRAGWELRLVVQGGLRILDKIAVGGYNSLQVRSRVRAVDLPTMLWRCLWM